MKRDSILAEFEPIQIENPSDIIIKQFQKLIQDGMLKPGDRLPSEVSLQEKFQVKRGVVREAIQKLEFFGILKTIPQSGTVVANVGPQIIEGLFNSSLQFYKDDYESLIDTRIILEAHAAYLAAKNANNKMIAEIREVQNQYASKAKSGDRGLRTDINFHIKIAQASGSSVLCSLITMISPDVLSMFHKLNKTSPERLERTIEEHEKILEAIESCDSDAAEHLMKSHLEAGFESSN